MFRLVVLPCFDLRRSNSFRAGYMNFMYMALYNMSYIDRQLHQENDISVFAH